MADKYTQADADLFPQKASETNYLVWHQLCFDVQDQGLS